MSDILMFRVYKKRNLHDDVDVDVNNPLDI